MVCFQHSDKERIHELEEENKKLQHQSESYEKHFIQLVQLFFLNIFLELMKWIFCMWYFDPAQHLFFLNIDYT